MFFEAASDIASKVAVGAERRLVAAAALAFLAVGTAGFATAALYLFLVEHLSPAAACAILAGVYVSALLILRSLNRDGGSKGGQPVDIRRVHVHADPPADDPYAHLLATFLAGVRAGRGDTPR